MDLVSLKGKKRYLSTAKVTGSSVLGGVAVARIAINGSTVVVASIR